MLSKIWRNVPIQPTRSNLQNAIYHVLLQVTVRNLLGLVKDKKRREEIYESGMSFSEIAYLLDVRVNKSMNYRHLDSLKAELWRNMPSEFITLSYLSRKKYVPSKMQRACQSLVSKGLFESSGSGPWSRRFRLKTISQIVIEDSFPNQYARNYAKHIRMAVRNAKLEDSTSNGAITLFGIRNWARLTEESRKKILDGAEKLAVLIRREYDALNDWSPEEFYSILETQTSERDKWRALDAELASIRNRGKEWIQSPLMIIDGEEITILPKALIAEQKRLSKLKKAKMETRRTSSR